eukprot:TRINITY_DN20422_c0_g1_i1.p1 TRINITY_DN20422_c0_g1~~TRINITY_DN20422_c0_g1_i1.p1  ORF type:complete len:718 (+),score=224.07 TRINITY_DN20422_c0_g1_i1:99-2156(+)
MAPLPLGFVPLADGVCWAAGAAPWVAPPAPPSHPTKSRRRRLGSLRGDAAIGPHCDPFAAARAAPRESTPCCAEPSSACGAGALPLDILSRVIEFSPVAVLPTVRCVCAWFRRALIEKLDADPVLARALAWHLERLLRGDGDQRVTVAVRLRYVDPQQALHEDAPLAARSPVAEVHRNRVTVGEDGDGPAPFFFDHCLGADATQTDVWGRFAGPVMRTVLRKENACILAYGQTGSGKTHTMFGNPKVPGEEGIAYRVVRGVAQQLRELKRAEGRDAEVEFSFLEVYNEKVYDLLNKQKHLPVSTERTVVNPGGKFTQATYGEGRVVAQGLSRRRCEEDRIEEQIGAWLRAGAAGRTVGQTVFNPRSSRSHAVATLHVKWLAGRAGQKDIERRLYLVDLAGSERAGKYALSQEQLREGTNINKSLSTLGNVVSSLARGKGEHVPERDSVLTWLLSDAITGRSARAFMVATLHPSHRLETISTLRYAQQYSSLQSDLSSRIPVMQNAVREQDRVVFKAAKELADSCASASPPWTRAALKARAVRSSRDARTITTAHPLLEWTDRHRAKWGDVGAVELVCDVPPPPHPLAPESDGRRSLGAHATQARGADAGACQCAQVVFQGRHGRPPTTLWFPVDALDDVPAPRRLKEILAELESAEEELARRKAALEQAKKAFAELQDKWMRRGD